MSLATVDTPPFDHPRFALGRRLGEGGMGSVFSAFDRLHEREVALKLGHPDEHLLDPARLADEFALLSTIAHPNIVRVLDLGRHERRLWLSSELVAGPRLDLWCERLLSGRAADTPPPAERLRALASDLLETLGWLASQGLVHGDLKPANILVRGDSPVLIDFGLAGAGEALLGGTRGYLAPELTGPDPARPSPASDLFALGRTLERVLGGDGPRPTHRPELGSPAIEALIAALTAPDPEDRPTAGEARALLEPCDPARPARPDRPTRPTRPTPPAPASPRPTDVPSAAPAWAGAIERIRARLATHKNLRLSLPAELAAPVLGALSAHLMLAGAPVCLLPDGEGLAPLARLLAALGHPVPAPTARAEDQREALDVFADAAVAALQSVAAPLRPTLLVGHPQRLGAGGRFVLARLVEARLLPHLVLAGHGAELALERGVDRTFGTESSLVISPAEATGRRLELEWRELSPPARQVARHLAALGGTANTAELASTLNANQPYITRALAELNARALTRRAPRDRVALDPALADAIFTILEAPPLTDAERSAIVLLAGRGLPLPAAPDHADAALPEPLLSAAATHAEALADFERAAELRLAAAELAANAFAWPRAAEHQVAAAALLLRRAVVDPSAAEPAFSAADLALRHLRAAGPTPTADLALALLERAALRLATAPAGPANPRLRDPLPELEVTLHKARLAWSRGDNAGAIAAASKVILHPAIPLSLRFEAHLLRGTAAAQTEDKALAEAELAEAARLAEALDDQHALGRTANNLGLLAFHRGDLAAAAEAWERAAAAKRRTGDRRGERIGLHNRGLALRELGRLDEAAALAERAHAIAEQIGDEVGRATAALARAQLALDRRDAPAAAAALKSFSTIDAKPALVEADGRVVTARLALLESRPEAASLANEALERAIDQQLEPVAAESWALALIASQSPLPIPPLVAKTLASAPTERGGLATLLLIAAAWHAAQLGDWSSARRHLQRAAERAHPELPPAARVARPLALETAELVAPELAETFAPARHEEARNMQTPSQAAPDAAPTTHPLENPDVLLTATLSTMTRLGDSPADLASWPRALASAAAADRCELAAGDLALTHDGSPPRYLSIARRVLASREPFIASADGRLEAFAAPLFATGAAPNPIGAAVLAFSPGLERVATPPDLGPLGALLSTLLEHRTLSNRLPELLADKRRLEGELAALNERRESEVTALRDALERSQSALALRYDYGAIVHQSRPMRRVLETLDKVTDRDLPVLVLGESGVGKELLARALHFNGPRKSRRFIAENCGAIPKDLFESHFFGHVKGAFTGATAPRQGLFEAADGGTIFLDEVGELPLEMQVKLLRVLQERKVRPVGSTREVPVDFRLVCATNRDLAQMVQDGRFREDLFYRVAVVRVEVPPLRERRDDILPIAQHLLETHGQRLGRTLRLSVEAADCLVSHAWPGNVRELENEILRALALAEGPEIKPRHFSATVAGRPDPTNPAAPKTRKGQLPGAANPDHPAELPADDQTLSELVLRLPTEPLDALFSKVEKAAITRVLRETHGQKSATARLLGLSRPGLDAKLARHGLDPREIKAMAKPATPSRPKDRPEP